jgi:MFS family permease
VLTRDAFLLGLVSFAGQIPAFVLVPFAGVLIDHWNRHRLVVITQTMMMLQALALTVLTWLDVINIPQLIVLSVVMGCLNAFDMPARQAFLPEMLTNKDDLSNAIALNSSLFNGARLVGPAVAGLTIALVGAKVCFLLNTLSFLAVIVALLRMDVPAARRPRHRPSVAQGLREGIHYTFGFAPIRTILLLVAVISLVGMPYTVLMPVVADRILGGGDVVQARAAASVVGHLAAPAWQSELSAASAFVVGSVNSQGPIILGLLMTASGLGALTGAIYMASRQTVLGLGAKIVLACCLFAGGLMVFSQSRLLGLSLGTMVVCGFGMMVMMASCNTILQTIVDDDKRGRVMSLYTMAFMGLAPFGSLVAGGVASALGTPLTMLLAGAGCLAAGLVFGGRLGTLRRLIRPIYMQRGILPEAASGMQPVQDLCKNAASALPDAVGSRERR